MSNIAQIMERVNGATFIGIDTCTIPKLKGGKGNPHKDLAAKVMTGASVMVFTNKNSNGYDNIVRRRLEQEGKDPNSFQLSPRKWGTRIEGTPFVVHTNKDGETRYYLEVIFLKPGNVHYELEGARINKADIIGLDEKNDEAEQGGLDNKVIIRTFAIESIIKLRAFGEVYEDLELILE